MATTKADPVHVSQRHSTVNCCAQDLTNIPKTRTTMLDHSVRNFKSWVFFVHATNAEKYRGAYVYLHSILTRQNTEVSDQNHAPAT
jgi:hypothetical protein